MQVVIAPMFNANTLTYEAVTRQQEQDIRELFSDDFATKYADEGSIIYPRVEDDEISVYLEAFELDMYNGWAASSQGKLLERWDSIPYIQ